MIGSDSIPFYSVCVYDQYLLYVRTLSLSLSLIEWISFRPFLHLIRVISYSEEKRLVLPTAFSALDTVHNDRTEQNRDKIK